jgi:hypothetical protein
MDWVDITRYLGRDGWPMEKLGDATLRSRFRGERRAFPFFVHADRTFLSFAVVPYVRLPAVPEQAEKLMTRLLHLNREMNLAKFSVDDDGDVVLSVEYPLADLDESEIKDALDVLSFYAEEHWPEIAGLAGVAA